MQNSGPRPCLNSATAIDFVVARHTWQKSVVVDIESRSNVEFHRIEVNLVGVLAGIGLAGLTMNRTCRAWPLCILRLQGAAASVSRHPPPSSIADWHAFSCSPPLAQAAALAAHRGSGTPPSLSHALIFNPIAVGGIVRDASTVHVADHAVGCGQLIFMPSESRCQR